MVCIFIYCLFYYDTGLLFGIIKKKTGRLGGIALFFQTSPFETRAEFLYRNVCDFPESVTMDKIEGADGEEILEGLKSLRQLLLEIYRDTAVYRVKDDLESYHNLIHTVLLLYTAGVYGELKREGEVTSLRLDKTLLRKHFKKPAGFYLDALQNYGFFFEYLKREHSCDTYQTCDTIIFCWDGSPAVFPALQYFVSRIPLMDSKKDYAMQTDLFLRADFETALSGAGKRKEDIDPLRPDILRSLGTKADLWKELVSRLLGKQGLKADCKFWSNCTPYWIIHFTRKGKPVCIFSIHTDTLFFECALPLERLAGLAMEKEHLDPVLQSGMERFGCIGCGQCGGENITSVNGISLCTQESWARRFAFEITSASEAQVAAELFDA
jgi:hypothetical protein